VNNTLKNTHFASRLFNSRQNRGLKTHTEYSCSSVNRHKRTHVVGIKIVIIRKLLRVSGFTGAGQWGQKQVGACGTLKYYCDFNEVRVFVGLHCSNCITMHGMQNEKKKKTHTEHERSLYTAPPTSQAYRQAYLIINFITRGAISRYTSDTVRAKHTSARDCSSWNLSRQNICKIKHGFTLYDAA